ncbi:MAG TPA: ABC transporter ATP-binding protein [Acidimicrobiales bacterium]|nr:ABC transporter ATP-binding protein [Acidimicrobiales bacterium]
MEAAQPGMPATDSGRAKDPTAKADHRAANALLRRATRQSGPWLAVLTISALLLAAAYVVLPAVIGLATDALLGRASKSWFTWLAVLIAALVCLDAAEDLATGETTAQSTAWLRRVMFRHVLSAGPKAVSRFGSGDIGSRVTGNAADVGRVASDAVRAVANVIPSVGGVVALGVIDPWLCVTFVIGLPILMLLVRSFAGRAAGIAQDYLATQAKIANSLVEALSGARTIAAAGSADREADRVLRSLPDLHGHGVAMWRSQINLMTQNALIVSLLEVAVLAVAGVEVAKGRITPGQLLAASQYVLLAATLGHASSSLTRITRDRAAARRVSELLNTQTHRYGTQELPTGLGQLEFRDVTVRSGERILLDRIDLVVPGGALVAVVGSSGSGKSLLGAVAGRMVDPDEGDVLLDGVSLRELSHHLLRSVVTYSFERPSLVGDTVCGAIRLGVFEPTEREVQAAARAARADGFIRRLPRGYETPLAEAPMSGGEAQRVGLARAFAHAGRLIILDDVAASLDTVTEHEVTATLTTELRDRTRIVIAHRASTAGRADWVVWMEKGRVREIAPHDELWRDRAYRALFNGDDEDLASAIPRSGWLA